MIGGFQVGPFQPLPAFQQAATTTVQIYAAIPKLRRVRSSIPVAGRRNNLQTNRRNN